MAPYVIFEITLNLYINSRTGILFPGCYMHAQWQNSQWVKMTLAVFPGISPCKSHTWLDMGLKLLARACPQNIIKVIKYFSYWVNWSDVACSQSSAMGQNDPYRPSSVKPSQKSGICNCPKMGSLKYYKVCTLWATRWSTCSQKVRLSWIKTPGLWWYWLVLYHQSQGIDSLCLCTIISIIFFMSIVKLLFLVHLDMWWSMS